MNPGQSSKKATEPILNRGFGSARFVEYLLIGLLSCWLLRNVFHAFANCNVLDVIRSVTTRRVERYGRTIVLDCNKSAIICKRDIRATYTDTQIHAILSERNVRAARSER